jgi:succinate dehydrogenase/fumarate reductase flavoprotein subunit
LLRIPEKWDDAAEVVVVGFGGAGASTAITAHDQGADVLILEKAKEGEEGGNTRVSGNVWLTPEPTEQASIYLKAMCGEYEVPEEMVRTWVEELSKNTQWVEQLGGKPEETHLTSKEFPDLPGSDSLHGYINDSILADESLWVLLKASVEKRGVRICYDTPGKRLIQNPATGEILGIVAEQGGKDWMVKAKKAVVLTCGGFENNPRMIRDYLTNLPTCYPKGTPYNTGDGITMALDVGADLWHMQNISGPQYSFKLPYHDVVMYPRGMPGFSYIYVTGTGERFVCEQAYFMRTDEGLRYPVKHGKILVHGQWVPSPTPPSIHCIFDEKLRQSGPLFGGHPFKIGWVEVLDLYSWSSDNSKEVEKGWIKQADTVGDLAREIKIDPAALEKTVGSYNRYCKTGKDPDFDRDPEALEPISEPPFYALPMVPNFINTQGGPRRNEKAQIVNPYGEPIPRLYSGGELGSIYGFLYQGGGNIGECMGFGRIAGRNAAAETSWD